MRKWVTIAMVVLVCLCSALYLRNRALQTDNDRLTANQTALMQKATYYKTEAGKSAASVQKLELTNSELKANYKQVCQTAE